MPTNDLSISGYVVYDGILNNITRPILHLVLVQGVHKVELVRPTAGSVYIIDDDFRLSLITADATGLASAFISATGLQGFSSSNASTGEISSRTEIEWRAEPIQ